MKLTYRDYLVQRFYQVEAGTVRMATSQDVDIRELFVMPSLRVHTSIEKSEDTKSEESTELMNLAVAREYFELSEKPLRQKKKKGEEKENAISALDQVKKHPRNVIIGTPGSGKSTFFEWLQLRLASGEEELVMNGKQAIPLLLRIRQLDPRKLPQGAALIEKALLSKDRTALMPTGWLDRQMKEGQIFFMLDGLDETEPELRDKFVIPWLQKLMKKFPVCRYLISSRPVGYPQSSFLKLRFAENSLLDFNNKQIIEYTKHWCTAIRLAQNEPEKEARKEGAAEGEKIVDGFKENPYIRDLAKNPLMLSAICLVNNFEGGELPKDRVLLYKFCVEGLLHHWDQKREIHSKFKLSEKLRVCREVALAMQTDDRAECEAKKVKDIFTEVLGNSARAEELLAYIRRRTGLLLERRSGIFAFVHLTFQEYLAAQAVYEGNGIGVCSKQMVKEHDDGRWKEVIALYCGMAPLKATRNMINLLIKQKDSLLLPSILAEAFLTSQPEITQDVKLRKKVIERIAIAPGRYSLGRFSSDEVTPIANQSIGKTKSNSFSEAYSWLSFHERKMDEVIIEKHLKKIKKMTPFQVGELVLLIHFLGSDSLLLKMAKDAEIYNTPGPNFFNTYRFCSQAEIAILGLSYRFTAMGSSMKTNVLDAAFLQCLNVFVNSKFNMATLCLRFPTFIRNRTKLPLPMDETTWQKFASMSRKLINRLKKYGVVSRKSVEELTVWVVKLEKALADKKKLKGGKNE